MSLLFSALQEQFRTVERESISKKAWERFCFLGLPNRGHEAFGYVPMRELLQSSFAISELSRLEKSDFSSAVLPECADSHLVFVDGRFSPELSNLSALPSQLLVLSTEEAQRTHGQFLQNAYLRSVREESDPFALLNLSLYTQGAWIYIPPRVECTSPIQCLFISTSSSPQIDTPRVHVALGKNSSARMYFSSFAKDPLVSHLTAPYTEITLDEGASFEWFSTPDASPSAWHFESIRAYVKRDAVFKAQSTTLGARSVRQSYRVYLMGENAETQLRGLWMLSESRTAHAHVRVDHEAPMTRSLQRFKGVLKDRAQSSFEGKIFVRDCAQKTEAYQLNNNLILSPGAMANAKPNLEIFADDVKASHGATVAQIDPEQLFYLTARGLSLQTARHLLVGGFCREMISEVSYPSLKQLFERQIEAFINGGEDCL